MKRKNILIYSLKGGVGKTSIAANLALTLGYSIISNEPYSFIDKVLPSQKCLKLVPGQDLPPAKAIKDQGVIFDFGGHLDERVIDAIKMSNLVIVPIIDTDDVNIQPFLGTLMEIGKVTKNIAIILNRMSVDECKEMQKALKKAGYNYPTFEIKKSKVFNEVLKTKNSVREIVEQGGLKKYMYEKVSIQFDEIIRHIEEKFGN